MKIKISQSGSFDKTIDLFEKAKKIPLTDFVIYGEMGLDALRSATPRNTGKTAESWSYNIKRGKDTITIEWNNSNTNEGYHIAVLIQYGHGTRNGGYVRGIDYINPAMRPIFEQIADEVWKEVIG